MGMQSYAKEYLVRLGFDLDNNSLSNALDNIQDGSSKLTNLMSKFSSSYIKGATSIVGFIGTASLAVGKLVSAVADADRETQINARSMWMSVDAYRALETSVESLGYSMSDLSSIAMNSELTGQLKELVQLSKGTDAPKELDTYLAKVRQTTFEFDKLKVLVKSGVRNVVYEFLKMSNTDLTKLHQLLRNFTSYIQRNLPDITKKIANVLYIIVQLGKALFNVLKWIVQIFTKIFKYFTETPAKLAVALSAITAVLFVLNPALSAMLMSLTAIFLLVDDYFGWKEGKKSLLGDKWNKVESLIKKVTKTYDSMIKAAEDILNSILSPFKWIKENVVDPLLDLLGKSDNNDVSGYDNFVDDLSNNKDLSTNARLALKSISKFNSLKDFLGDKINLKDIYAKASIGGLASTGIGSLVNAGSFINAITSGYDKINKANVSNVSGSNNKTTYNYKQNITVQGNMTDNQVSNINRNFNKVAKGKNLASVIR